MKPIFKLLFFTIIFLSSCKKDWLNAKPDKKLVVPETVSDMQGMLDNDLWIFNRDQPSLGEIGTDDYYLLFSDWEGLFTNTERNGYIWAKDIYNNESVFDWIMPYQRIFYENYILENIDEITPGANNQLKWNNVKGSALFGRGFDFYSLADVFAKPFDSATCATDLGIPLRLHSDINEKSTRATVLQTYSRIIEDLTGSIQFLPSAPEFKTRPSKAAAYAMLARTYLNMGEYQTALNYADSCIKIQPALMDYNQLDINQSFPFPKFNDEVIYHATINYPYILSQYFAIVDSTLYRSYADNDLRKYLFFDTTDGHVRFKGGYDSYYGFAGIATDEVYLMRAECYARTGNATEAINDLNTLLESRWKKGTFTPFTASNPGQALILILSERRKELLFRGLRWTDLRRLNKDPRFAVTLTRNLNGDIYTLPPNDNRYVYPIPDQEIQISGIAQNPR